jgi:hypothetical protein
MLSLGQNFDEDGMQCRGVFMRWTQGRRNGLTPKADRRVEQNAEEKEKGPKGGCHHVGLWHGDQLRRLGEAGGLVSTRVAQDPLIISPPHQQGKLFSFQFS